MTKSTLLVFEGSKTEPNIFNSLEVSELFCPKNSTVHASFGHNIYQLYKEINKDNGLTLIGILQETIEKRELTSNQSILNIEQWDIRDIYLFFDFDPHTSNSSNESLLEMLALFNDSQDNGHLFISYPMIEAIRHINHIESSVLHPNNDLENYKAFLNQKDDNNHFINISSEYHNWGLYTKQIWKNIIRINLKRANDLVCNEYTLPESIIEQDKILLAQIEKHINDYSLISVISALPLMLHNYYGADIFQTINA